MLCWAAGLVLRIFLALLPILLRLMGRVQGLYSQSALDFSVVTKYYIFQACAALPRGFRSDQNEPALLPDISRLQFRMRWLCGCMRHGRRTGSRSTARCTECVLTTCHSQRRTGKPQGSALHRACADRMLCRGFQIITVFFGTLIAGSIASQIKVFLEQPTLFLTTLGTAAPLTSIFFLTYVQLNVRARRTAAQPAVASLASPGCSRLSMHCAVMLHALHCHVTCAALSCYMIRLPKTLHRAVGMRLTCRLPEEAVSWPQALAITPISFLNVVALVIFWVLSFFAATERAKARLWQNQFMSYGSKARPRRSISCRGGCCCRFAIVDKKGRPSMSAKCRRASAVNWINL